MLLRARTLVPITAPPMDDGAVLVSEGRVQAAGPWRELRGSGPWREVTDLGDVILFPGLVNAHCHLEYTHMACCLSPPRSFTDWIKGVLALKSGWSFSEYAASWLSGAKQLLASGCTTVMDFEAVPELLPEVWNGTSLRVISALELTGIRAARTPEQIVSEALATMERITPGGDGNRIGLAPHAPYSTRPELLRLCGRIASERRVPLACHVAESAEEFEMFMQASGPMYQWLRTQRDMSDCGSVSPVGHVAAMGLLGAGTQLVHMNYLAPGDADRVAESGASVVHCPRSHDYFGHAPFPYRELLSAGVPVVLGTDSLLSVRALGRGKPRLSLSEEMRAFRHQHETITPEDLLRMVTTSAASSIGMAGMVGEIRPGAMADLAWVGGGGPPRDALEAIVEHTGPVAGVMTHGNVVDLEVA